MHSPNAGHTERNRGTNERFDEPRGRPRSDRSRLRFGADEFLVEVANDPTGATYRGRIGLRFVSDEEIKKMDEAKKRCYGIVCAAGAAGEFVALGNIAQQNLHDESKDRAVWHDLRLLRSKNLLRTPRSLSGGGGKFTVKLRSIWKRSSGSGSRRTLRRPMAATL